VCLRSYVVELEPCSLKTLRILPAVNLVFLECRSTLNVLDTAQESCLISSGNRRFVRLADDWRLISEMKDLEGQSVFCMGVSLYLISKNLVNLHEILREIYWRQSLLWSNLFLIFTFKNLSMAIVWNSGVAALLYIGKNVVCLLLKAILSKFDTKNMMLWRRVSDLMSVVGHEVCYTEWAKRLWPKWPILQFS
jgi:hypothetical protein